MEGLYISTFFWPATWIVCPQQIATRYGPLLWSKGRIQFEGFLVAALAKMAKIQRHALGEKGFFFDVCSENLQTNKHLSSLSVDPSSLWYLFTAALASSLKQTSLLSRGCVSATSRNQSGDERTGRLCDTWVICSVFAEIVLSSLLCQGFFLAAFCNLAVW